MTRDTQFDWQRGQCYEPGPLFENPNPPVRGWGGYAFLALCGVAVIGGVAAALFT